MVKKCATECKTDLNEVKEFELTTDFNSLPNSPELKCYFLCGYIEVGFMKPNSPKVTPDRFLDLLNQMEKDDQRKYLTMSKGCSTKVKSIKNPTEVAYQANVCLKRNSVEVFILFVRLK